MMQVVDFPEARADDRRMVRGIQIKLARIALGWGQRELAERAGLSVITVHRAERADQPPLTVGNLSAIQRALQDGGIIFIGDGETSPPAGSGIRFRRQP
jgi:transcriptional regulator with XRE-family HTH domain